MSVKIIADSTCDLSKELLEKYEISILPLHIVLGDKEYKDGLEILPDEIYAWSNANKEAPKTSAASISDAIELFESNLKSHDEIVCFSISGQMSTTVNVMRMAAEELDAEDKIRIIDSENLSTGGGLLVIEAAIMASAGKSGKEIVNAIEQLKPQVKASFIVDTLTFLHRGGRCSGVAAFGANLLSLKPCIVVKDAKMGVGKKYRGKFGAVLPKYVSERLGDGSDVIKGHIFVTHAGCEPAIINACVEAVKAIAPEAKIHITRAGCTISSHCGRNTLGVLFIRTHALGE